MTKGADEKGMTNKWKAIGAIFCEPIFEIMGVFDVFWFDDSESCRV
jgi:hypothetical protein